MINSREICRESPRLEEAQDAEGDPIAEGATYLFLDASSDLATTIYQQI
ncbi:hypothetical protein AB0C27_24770 [Nonomuraea sp. NPDC048882]